MPVQLFGRDQIMVQYEIESEGRTRSISNSGDVGKTGGEATRGSRKKSYGQLGLKNDIVLAQDSVSPKEKKRERRKSSLPRLFTPYTDDETYNHLADSIHGHGVQGSSLGNTPFILNASNVSNTPGIANGTVDAVNSFTNQKYNNIGAVSRGESVHGMNLSEKITFLDKCEYHTFRFLHWLKDTLDVKIMGHGSNGVNSSDLGVHGVNVSGRRTLLSRLPKIYKISIIHWVLLFTLVTTLLYHFLFNFNDLYEKSAVLNNMLVSFCLFGTSDCMAQMIHVWKMNSNKIQENIDKFTYLPFYITHGQSHINAHHLQSGNKSPHLSTDTTTELAAEFDLEDQHGDTDHTDHTDHTVTQEYTISLDQSSGETDFQFYRWVCFIMWGVFMSVPQCFWYKFLNFIFTDDPTFIQTLERMLCDQLVYSPISLYFFFKYSSYVIEHGDDKKFQTKIKDLYLSTLAINFMIWPLAQIINFSLVEKKYQPIFSSTISVFWNCFLSFRNSKQSRK